ncbi:hypothetical protein [Halococcus agarilyticus]|uniref:hypothetical protein n=1 Tax=Halococcus agarilyticus TaxID=1232219 RepID=UPI000677FDBB|nr:hypothetical protein [Halococcus agarilyticus]
MPLREDDAHASVSSAGVPNSHHFARRQTGARVRSSATALNPPLLLNVLDELDGSPSVADLNPEYGASGPIATVAFAGESDEAAEWREADSEALAGIAADHELRTYTYPRERLRHVEDAADDQGGDPR